MLFALMNLFVLVVMTHYAILALRRRNLFSFFSNFAGSVGITRNEALMYSRRLLKLDGRTKSVLETSVKFF